MINVAIIGAGNISGAHIEGYRAFPQRCRITALADIYPEKAAEKAVKEHLNVPVYGSMEELLEKEDIQLVSLCTPPFTHRDLAVRALEAGVNVLLEKPMASSLEECDAINRAEEKSGASLSVVAQNRFRSPVWNMKKVLEEGLIGKLLHSQINSYWWRGYPYYDLWWRGTWEKEGGGCTLNHAVHHIDMMLWLTGMPKELAAMMGNVAHDNSEVEDLSMALLRFGDNSFAQVTSSVVHHGEKQEMILQGSDARISAPLEAAASLSAPNGFPDRNGELEKKIEARFQELGELPHQGHTGQIEDMLSAIEDKRPPLVTGMDGRNAIELIMGIYKAATEASVVTFPLTKEDPFYSVPGILKTAPRFYEKKNSVTDQGDGNITLGSDYKKEA
jgi:UDP-N-acetyl-2-amino-2-deoxyglucuronate dehydrogenase